MTPRVPAAPAATTTTTSAAPKLTIHSSRTTTTTIRDEGIKRIPEIRQYVSTPQRPSRVPRDELAAPAPGAIEDVAAGLETGAGVRYDG